MTHYNPNYRPATRHLLFVAIFVALIFTGFSTYAQSNKVQFATIVFATPTVGKTKIIKHVNGKTEKITMEKNYEFFLDDENFMNIVDEQLTSMASLGFKLITMSAMSGHGYVHSLIYTFRKE